MPADAARRVKGDSFRRLASEITSCTACPRLVSWRETVAERARLRTGAVYWARPVTGFGDRHATLAIVGLAPAANGANRTGRIFTGDRSGDFLFAALWRAGFANQPTSTGRRDGLALTGCYVTACLRCAPPENRPATAERDTCMPFLARELALLDGAAGGGNLRVTLALGGFAHGVCARLLGIRPTPRFAHGAEASAPSGTVLVASYHPSQQNTFTGRLTPAMIDQVLGRVRELALGAAPRGERRP